MKPATGELLVEIGCEEIPADMISAAATSFKAVLEKYFEEERLLNGARIETFGAPRRLVASCSALRFKQQDIDREVKGPPKAVAFDAEGKPTRAAESFAAKQGLPVSELAIVSTPRGDYVCARQTVPGRAAIERLSEVLPRAICEISWPRTMYWTGASGMRFIRPVRWLLAVLGGKRIAFDLDGISADKVTQGHRFLGRRRIQVAGLEDYVTKLRANYVLALPSERREKVDRELSAITTDRNLTVNADASLAEKVVYLNEYPTVIIGDFAPSYLDLPEEILITVMRDHQKYFGVRAADGRLAPHFLAVINLNKDERGLIRAGHERVLRARFADARFFWQTDQKCRLADYLARLDQVTFQAKLGSYGHKTKRVRALAGWIARQLLEQKSVDLKVEDVDRAALLSKCDLVTGMVREFTELQGIVGGLYARHQGESEVVAEAVYDQYLPNNLNGEIPRGVTGEVLALADNLDTLTSCFAVGLAPTGSSDPFALRRAAQSIVKIIVEGNLKLSIPEAIGKAASGVASIAPNIKVSQDVIDQIIEFLSDRARHFFVQLRGFALDEVNAALAAGADDLVDAEARVAALREIRQSYDFEPLAISFKRIRKIIEKAGSSEQWLLPSVRPELFEEDAERNLHFSASRVARQAEEYKRSRRYREALQEIAGLRADVDAFFDHVMVMAERDDVRRNRLTLLHELLHQFSTIADFSELVPAANEAR